MFAVEFTEHERSAMARLFDYCPGILTISFENQKIKNVDIASVIAAALRKKPAHDKLDLELRR